MNKGHLAWKGLTIMEALYDAGQPIKSSEVEDATGIHRTGVTKYIKWNLLNKYVEIDHTEPQRNGQTIKFFTLNPRGWALMEERQ